MGYIIFLILPSTSPSASTYHVSSSMLIRNVLSSRICFKAGSFVDVVHCVTKKLFQLSYTSSNKKTGTPDKPKNSEDPMVVRQAHERRRIELYCKDNVYDSRHG